MKKEVHKMITLTDIDVINLLRKNGLDADELQTNVVELLAKNGLKIATAESCTGGLISERITSVSGASAVFDCGICSYANSIKEKLLGVSYTPIYVLSSQVVSGTNYCVLSKAEVVAPGAEGYYTLATVYQDLSGNVEITEFLTSASG